LLSGLLTGDFGPAGTAFIPANEAKRKLLAATPPSSFPGPNVEAVFDAINKAWYDARFSAEIHTR
jgi:hypothetical protein